MFYGIIVRMYALDNKQHKQMQAWIALHSDDLRADWTLAAGGTTPYKIEPLK